MTLGGIIAEYREKNNVSLHSFAKKVGLSKSYLFSLENGRNPTNGKEIRPTLETVLACCEAMGMDIVTFLRKLDPAIAQKLQPKVTVKSDAVGKKNDSVPPAQGDALAQPILYIPAEIPPAIRITVDEVLSAFKEQRLLILPSRIPCKGDLVYIPIKQYMMPVAFTVSESGGGLFSVYAESCGTRIYSIFDLERSVFSSRSGAQRVVEAWRAEEKPLLKK